MSVTVPSVAMVNSITASPELTSTGRSSGNATDVRADAAFGHCAVSAGSAETLEQFSAATSKKVVFTSNTSGWAEGGSGCCYVGSMKGSGACQRRGDELCLSWVYASRSCLK